MNPTYETRTLSHFRIAGLKLASQINTQAEDCAKLWQIWQNSSHKQYIPSFSHTLYCVFQYQPNHQDLTIILGKLVTGDAILPDGISDIWIPPQVYAVYTLPENHFQAAPALWKDIQSNTTLKRRQLIDFESYPKSAQAKIYVGLEQKVEITETY